MLIDLSESRSASFLVRMRQKEKDLHCYRTFLSELIVHEEQLLTSAAFQECFLLLVCGCKEQHLPRHRHWQGRSGVSQPPWTARTKQQTLGDVRLFSVVPHNHTFPQAAKLEENMRHDPFVNIEIRIVSGLREGQNFHAGVWPYYVPS